MPGKTYEGHIYTTLEFENVANALNLSGIGSSEVAAHKVAFDVAAQWFAMMKNYRDRIPAKDTLLALKTIANSAERVVRQGNALTGVQSQAGEPGISEQVDQLSRSSPIRFNNSVDTLLKKLSVTRETACDGVPDDFVSTLLQHTSNPKKLSETEIPPIDDEQTLTDLLETISETDCEIEMAVEVADELATRARNGITTLKEMRKNMIPEGNTGDAAINGWIDDMLNLYMKITDRPVGTSTIKPEVEGTGEPSGPLIRFLKAAGEPVGLYFPDAGWKSRIATARRVHDQKKT